MKTLSGTFRFVVLGVIVILVIVGCCNLPFPLIKDTKSCFGLGNSSVEIGHWPGAKSKDGTIYVEWKNQGKFDAALKHVCDHGGTYCLNVKLDNSTIIDPYHPKGYKDCTNCSVKNIRTVKVTKSKAADNIATGESAVNDPHVTYRIQSPDPRDIITVLDTLQPAP